MNQYNCLIVDDEPIPRNIIQAYCSHLPMLHIVASCINSLEAKQTLQQHKTDIVFLDINMPVLNGIAFMRTLKHPPMVIFTTAYKEYAVDAFDLAACDYLLKPFSLERFIVAVDKAVEKLQAQPAELPKSQTTATEDYFFIKTDGKIFKVPFDVFLFAEAQGNYTRIVTTQTILLPTMPISSLEELLPRTLFPRVHRSYIIAQSKITHIEGNRVFVGKNEIPIGSNYKKDFLSMLGLT